MSGRQKSQNHKHVTAEQDVVRRCLKRCVSCVLVSVWDLSAALVAYYRPTRSTTWSTSMLLAARHIRSVQT